MTKSDFMTAGMLLADVKKSLVLLDELRDKMGPAGEFLSDVKQMLIWCDQIIRKHGPDHPDLVPIGMLIDNRLSALQDGLSRVADEFDLDLPDLTD